MSGIFLTLLNISLTAGWLILAVILLRLILKKAPKTVNFILWALVAVRLICPFSLQSALSLIPSAEPVRETVISQAAISVDSGINAVDENVNQFLNTHYNEAVAAQSENAVDIMGILAIVWIVGLAVMLMFFAFSFIRISRQTSASINLKERIFLCDDINSPFILGVIKPKIFIPSGMSEEQMEYVISHEKAHLKHLDQWWKPLGFMLLSVYWFNPLMWAAYLLLCKDIELACDERVIKNMSKDSVAGYSQALLDCVSNKRTILSCPVAFGEVATKERVKKVLNYKKPTFWIIIVAIIASIIVAVCFMTNPVNTKLKFIDTEEGGASKAVAYFSKENSAEKILNDLKNIDLYYKEPDYKSLGLTEKVQVDEESSTKTINYYDGDKLVYTDYEGFGEDCFDYYTETASKKPVKVTYIDQDGGRYEVHVKGENYGAFYEKLNKKAPFSADKIYINILKINKDNVNEYLNLDIEGNKCTVSNAGYYKDGDFISYSTYDENGKLYDDEYDKFECNKTAPNLDIINAVLANKDKQNIQTLFGMQHFSYSNVGNAKKWYITTNIKVLFDSEEKAKEFAQNKAFEGQETEVCKESNGLTVQLKNVNIPLADGIRFDSRDVFQQIEYEIDDPVYRILKFEGNELVGLEPRGGELEYY